MTKAEQDDDDGKKACGIKSFGQTEDKDQLSNTDERVECIVEKIIDDHVLRVTDDVVEGVKCTAQERVRSYTVEQSVDVPDPLIREETVEVIPITGQNQPPGPIRDEVAEKRGDYEKSYEQFVKCMKLGIRENFVDDFEIAELWRFNTSKSGDEQISFKEYVDRMKEGQNDNYHITGESIAVVFPSSFWKYLHKKGHEVPYMADPVIEYVVHQLEEFDGTKLKPTMKEGLDLGDQDEKKTFEELKIESEPLRKLMNEALGDKVEEAIVNDRIVDSLRVLTMSEYGLSANMERIMKAQAPRDDSIHLARGSQQEREGRKEESEKVEGEEWETVVGKRRRKEKREKKRDRREKVGTQEGGAGARDQEGRKKEKGRLRKEEANSSRRT